MPMKIFTTFAAAAALSLGLAAPAGAQSYPDKPVNYIIPFGPGGESDITARHQQAFYGKTFGEELVIEYKPGGGGRSEEHTSELQSLMRISYAVFCLKKKKNQQNT